jgi:hypothetical protein
MDAPGADLIYGGEGVMVTRLCIRFVGFIFKQRPFGAGHFGFTERAVGGLLHTAAFGKKFMSIVSRSGLCSNLSEQAINVCKSRSGLESGKYIFSPTAITKREFRV